MPVTPRPATDIFPVHGGDLAFATRRYGEPAEGWLDLSTGINPQPWPAAHWLARADLTRLPDAADLDALLAAARAAYGIAPDVAIAATPGSEIAIRLLPAAVPPGAVAIVSPTYATHAAAWRAAGRGVAEVPSLAEVPADAAIAVAGNPNNPDARTTSPAELAALATKLGARGGLLVVDEAFADTTPENSLAPALDGLPAVVLRSLGKFYGLPGLRLGFVAGDAAIVTGIQAALGAWPISTPAIAIGTAALSDTAWQEATRKRLHGASQRLAALLGRHGLRIAGATSLFVLVEDDNARHLHVALASQGIWTRIFAGNPRHLRVGLPPDDAVARLDAALAAVTDR